MFKPERRESARDNAHCRSCTKRIKKGEEAIFWYSSANRGMNIIICLDCGNGIGELCNIGHEQEGG